MEPLNYFLLLVILFAIFLMAMQNLSMLSAKWRIFYVGILLIKITVTYINAFYPGTVPMAGVDYVNYTAYALQILDKFPNIIIGIFQSEQTLFAKEVALVFYLFGVNRVYIYFLVCFGSLIAFKYMILMAKEMTDDYELAQKCGLLYSIWPILLVFASTFLRENQCNFLFILSFYNFVRFIKRHNFVYFAYAIFWSILAAMTHSGMIALVICYCVIGSMASKSGEIEFSPIKIGFGLLLIVGIMCSPLAGGMTEKFGGAENAQSVEEFTGSVAKEKVRDANTQYVASIPSNPIKLLLLEPYLFLMFVLAPLPYQIHSVGQGISFLIESIPQFCLIRAMFIYLVLERKKGSPQVKGYKTIGLWTLLLFYFIFSLGTANYGTAIRHRAKITPMLLVFAVMYYAEKKSAVVGSKKEDEGERKEQEPFSLWKRLLPAQYSLSPRFPRIPRFLEIPGIVDRFKNPKRFRRLTMGSRRFDQFKAESQMLWKTRRRGR